MTTYYLPPPPAEGMTAFPGVVNEEGGWIPPDPANRHWAEYQEWLAIEGNEPTPWPEGGPEFAQPAPPPPTS